MSLSSSWNQQTLRLCSCHDTGTGVRKQDRLLKHCSLAACVSSINIPLAQARHIVRVMWHENRTPTAGVPCEVRGQLWSDDSTMGGSDSGNNNSSTTVAGTHCAGTPRFCYPPAALKSLISSKNNFETIYITLFYHKIAMPTVSADTCVADGSELGPQGPVRGLR